MSSLWSDICKARYEREAFGSPMGGREDGLKKVSHWWRGISLVEGPTDQESDWFSVSCLKRDGMERWSNFGMMYG